MKNEQNSKQLVIEWKKYTNRYVSDLGIFCLSVEQHKNYANGQPYYSARVVWLHHETGTNQGVDAGISFDDPEDAKKEALELALTELQKRIEAITDLYHDSYNPEIYNGT